MSTNKFLLFAGGSYYPAGGWKDFVGEFDTLEAAKECVDSEYTHEKKVWAGYRVEKSFCTSRWDWAHVVHGTTMLARWSARDELTGDEWWYTPDE